MKLQLAVLVVSGLVAVTSAGCGTSLLVPEGAWAIDTIKSKVCGWRAIFAQKGTSAGIDEIDTLGLRDSWFALDQDHERFEAVTMPMGSNIRCGHQRYSKFSTPFGPDANAYVRNEFELDPAVISTLTRIRTKYQIDGKIEEIFINGQRLNINLPARKTCSSISRIGLFHVPGSMLRAGKNTIALRASPSAHKSTFLDIGMHIDFCGIGGPLFPCMKTKQSACRARCAEQNTCQNKLASACGSKFVPDVTGDFFCMTAPGLACSGPFSDAAPGVCYESSWINHEATRPVGPRTIDKNPSHCRVRIR